MSGLALKVGTVPIGGVALAGIENLENLKGWLSPTRSPARASPAAAPGTGAPKGAMASAASTHSTLATGYERQRRS